MMAYTYKAALLCEACAAMVCHDIRDGIVPGDLDSADSDEAPQGPYANGGGEADSPQHCDHCNAFLENPLTTDGVEYVENAIARLEFHGKPVSGPAAQWRAFYLGRAS